MPRCNGTTKKICIRQLCDLAKERIRNGARGPVGHNETQGKNGEDREERGENRGIVGQRPLRRKTSKKVDKKLKEIIERLEQRCDLLSGAT
jgi:hypothetical protein